jgi:hypothetical protein
VSVCRRRAARDAHGVPSRQYRVVVAGELSDPIGRAFEGMNVSLDGGNTVLVGPLRDQAELHGLLQRVSDFGLTLLSANAIEDETTPESAETAPH